MDHRSQIYPGGPAAGRPGTGNGTGRVVAVVAAAAVAGVLVALLVLPVLGLSLFGRTEVITGPTGGPSTTVATPPSTPVAPPTGPRAPASASASATCVSANSQDASGATVGYGAGNAIDGLTDTAWRCDGDGVGAQLRIDLGRTLQVTRVGLLPGYAKLDPVDGTDRFRQNRRVTSVRYTFDNGSAVTQTLDPDDPSIQSTAVPAVSTRTVTVTILGSVAGADANGRPAVDKVAVSEVAIS